MIRHLIAVAALTLPTPVFAQNSGDPPEQPDTTANPVEMVEEDKGPADKSTVLIAGISGGFVQRDALTDSPYASASLTYYRDDRYLRGGLTVFQSSIRQVDAALPSTYYLGSLGAGGAWKGWVLDAYVTAGRQDFGQITTLAGSRDSQAGSGAGYLSVGARAGRKFNLTKRMSITPTASLQYVTTYSLRHAILDGRPQDLLLPERATTGSAAMRLDRSLGLEGRSQIGLSFEHFVSDNGSTVLSFSPDGTGSPVLTSQAHGTPDSWQEIGLNGTFALSRSLWLDCEVRRSIGSISSNATTASIGFRIRM